MNLNRVKGDSSGVIEHALLVAVLALVAVLVVHTKLLWRWDNLLYDGQLSFWSRDVGDDVIIIAIDDESLNDLGRWPWPRSVHARLLGRLEQESPRAIGLDIILSEADSNAPASDVLLARAMQVSGKVVLPVFMSRESSNAYPREDLPLPEFAEHAAAMGHVHVDISHDGIARRVYLKEGIGKPHWMHFALAVLSITDEAVELLPEADRAARQQSYSAMRWHREYPYLIPYAGPPGHFPQIGYSQVLAGEYPKDLFRDRIVLIGATAEGMGDALPTPLSGDGGAMPGVEIVANVIDGIRNDLRIIELGKPWLLVLTALLVALPVLVYPYLNPASTLLVLFSIVASTILLVAVTLWLFGVWIPVSTVLLFQFLSYPLWSWRRLVLAMRHINAELNQLAARQKDLSVRRGRNIADEIRFIAQFVPIKGWALQDEDGSQLIAEGAPPVYRLGRLKPVGWSVDGYSYWAPARYDNRPCRLGLSIGPDVVIADDELRLLNGLIDRPLTEETVAAAYHGDVLQARIRQVQAVGSEYEELRRIIDDSLSGMADGLLICTGRGQVMLSNRRAGWYLFGDDDAVINGRSLVDILGQVDLKDGDDWAGLLQRVLSRRERVLAEAQHHDGRDLMVEISPLRITGDTLDGFIINFSDISMLKASERKRSEVLNFLSHDLRSPLSSMIAMIELAKNKSSVEDMRAMLEDMESSTHKTLHLAEQFLQLSRASASEEIQFHDVDFNSVVLNAIDQLWGLSSKSGVTVTYEFDREELWTHAEPDMLERAVTNLLSNAIKHSPSGATVRILVQLERDEISCCVIDQGTGIDAEDLPHLFEMFRRTQGAGVERIQGVGLGLAFVDAVAKRHAGRVDVESRPGEGSSFCLRIPRHEPVQAAEQSE